MELIEERMKDWRAAYDDMMIDTAEVRDQLLTLQAILQEVEQPYKERMAEIEGEIKPFALARAVGVQAHGVVVSYRSGYERVSYDRNKADVVLGVLRDVLPETAKSLEGARKVSFVQPSVTIRAVKGD